MVVQSQEPEEEAPVRITSIHWVVAGVLIWLPRRSDKRIDAQELSRRRVVVAVDERAGYRPDRGCSGQLPSTLGGGEASAGSEVEARGPRGRPASRQLSDMAVPSARTTPPSSSDGALNGLTPRMLMSTLAERSASSSGWRASGGLRTRHRLCAGRHKETTMTLIEAEANDYLEWMEIHNYARTTIEGRGRYLGYFITFAEDRGVDQAKEVTLELLLAYQHALFAHRKRNGEPLSFGTQAQRLVPVDPVLLMVAP